MPGAEGRVDAMLSCAGVQWCVGAGAVGVGERRTPLRGFWYGRWKWSPKICFKRGRKFWKLARTKFASKLATYFAHTSWFKLNAPNCASPERRLQYLLDRMSHIWYHTDYHEQQKRVAYYSQFFGGGILLIGLALAVKLCPDHPRAFKNKVNNRTWHGVSVGINNFFFIVFLNEPVPDTPRHICEKLRASIRRSQ